tara:strand:+ start:89 stop:646 length:558 start_codon:yes stop_codon:yes gene_type:complete
MILPIEYVIMNIILYYSNYCKFSKDLLNKLSKLEKRKEIHFISIDDRKKGKNGEILVTLQNGKNVILPPNITKVPAIMLLNRGNRVIFGNEIIEYFNPRRNNVENIIKTGPVAFGLGDIGSIISDNYSFLDTEAKDLLAKGDGGSRMMHNYAGLDYESNIETPPEDKIEKPNIDISKIQESRNNI